MAPETQVQEQASPTRDLEPMFAPESIAAVGASRRAGSVGYAVAHNLIFGGYTGVVYPVNPKAKSILGTRCVKSVGDIDDHVDLAIIMLPPKIAEKVIAEAADRGTKHFLIISAGFKEVGGEGAKIEQRIAEMGRERGLSLVGPNCLGVINTADTISMNATFARDMPRRGNLGLISQSGALCTALLDYAKGRGIGFSRVASFGNKVDVNEIDLMRSFHADPNTRVIVMYVEELSSGQEFVRAAMQITRGPNPTPIVAIKSGRTQEGAAAAASHTGSLAGSDEVYEAIMKQGGVIRVDHVDEMFDLAEVFGDPQMPGGRRTAIVTNAGGPGIMATDAAIRHDLQLSKFQDYTTKSLKFQMPPTAATKNPVDVIGDATHQRYRAALDAVVADEGVDQVCVIVTPQNMTDCTEIADVVAETRGFAGKPITACLMGAVDVSAGIDLLRDRGVPHFTFPEDAMRAMATKSRFAEWRRRPIHEPKTFEVNADAVSKIFDEELAAGRPQMIEAKAIEVFEHYGFPMAPSELAADADAAVAAAEGMGYPVVMKIVGPEILHKTDVGGVKLNLDTADAVRAAYEAMIASARKHLGDEVEIWGVLIQKMMPSGKEIILGMTRDAKFGPLLMFGLGGIYTEALKDVSFRLAPITQASGQVMVGEIRAKKLLEGVRGEKPTDLDAVVESLQRLSQLVTDHPRIKELDVNPLIAYGKGEGAVLADARIILSEQ